MPRHQMGMTRHHSKLIADVTGCFEPIPGIGPEAQVPAVGRPWRAEAMAPEPGLATRRGDLEEKVSAVRDSVAARPLCQSRNLPASQNHVSIDRTIQFLDQNLYHQTFCSLGFARLSRLARAVKAPPQLSGPQAFRGNAGTLGNPRFVLETERVSVCSERDRSPPPYRQFYRVLNIERS